MLARSTHVRRRSRLLTRTSHPSQPPLRPVPDTFPQLTGGRLKLPESVSKFLGFAGIAEEKAFLEQLQFASSRA